MSEADATGYQESPDTTDGPVAEDRTGDGQESETAVTLTTDDDAQQDDSVMRPGNVAD